MHVLNHVLTSRSRVQKHNRRIKQLTEGSLTSENNDLVDDGDDQWRDQGYTRPKVLLLFPTRGTCWVFVKKMIELLGDSAILEMEDRFDTEFGPIKRQEQEGNNDDEVEDGEKARLDAIMKQKGREWNELFGEEANDDDDFKIGISLTPNVDNKKKNSTKGPTVTTSGSGVKLKLFADFFHCDIILASPIGLKMSTANDGSDDEEEDDKANADFLSSIEVCIVARSDVLMMQNWDHVNSVLDSLNQQPKHVSDIDFSRVRNYFLEGQGRYWRQMILVSAFTDAYVLSTFRRHAKNVEGQMRIRKKVPTENASICDVMVRVKQVFLRMSCPTVSEAGSARLRFFADHVLPKLQRLKQKHTLIYIPSYFDFVAVRNLLLKREAKFVSVTEYARISEVSRGRARFLQGLKPIMLYTGRAHFFLRHKIKGARHLIFFGLPEYDKFYPAVVNMLNEGLTDDEEDDVSRLPMSALSLFTKFDAHQLERIVGTSHAERMINGDKSSYVFCS
jgi:U3 small nucleolar RNA-associated protein 25